MFSFKVPCVRGLMAGREFLLAAMPLRTLVSLLRIDNHGTTLERSQREVNTRKAKAFGEYLLNNRDSFVIPTVVGVTVTPEGVVAPKFIPASDASPSVGELEISIDSKCILFDGQHRMSGCQWALEQDPSIGTETVSIKLFTDMSLQDRQCAFSDINGNATRVNASINTAYNHRDPLSRMAVYVAENANMFKGMTDYEKTVANGDKLYTLKGIKDSLKVMFSLNAKSEITEEMGVEAVSRFNALSNALSMDYYFSDQSVEKIRNSNIKTHGVMLKSFAMFLSRAINQVGKLEDVDFSKLTELDFSRKGSSFIGRTVAATTETMIVNSDAVTLACNLMLKACGLPISPEASQVEKKHFPESALLVDEKDLEPISEIEEIVEPQEEVVETEKPVVYDDLGDYRGVSKIQSIQLIAASNKMEDAQMQEVGEKFQKALDEVFESGTVTLLEAKLLNNLDGYIKEEIKEGIINPKKALLNIRSIRAIIKRCMNQ